MTCDCEADPRVFATSVAFKGPLDLRAPEERFAADDEVEGRFQQPVQNREIDAVADEFLIGWTTGDDDAARVAGSRLVELTRAHFARQGVPTFAHPVLPPQFVDDVIALVRRLPESRRAAAASAIVDTFAESDQAGIDEEFAARLTRRQSPPSPRRGSSSGGAHGCGCSGCAD